MCCSFEMKDSTLFQPTLEVASTAHLTALAFGPQPRLGGGGVRGSSWEAEEQHTNITFTPTFEPEANPDLHPKYT